MPSRRTAQPPVITRRSRGETDLAAEVQIVPVPKSFAPISGPVGTQVILTGTSSPQATSVKFVGKTATFTVNSDTQIATTAPTGSVTGKISLTNPGGIGNSSSSLTVQ